MSRKIQGEMSEVIRGKKYDTSTAEWVASWSNGYYSNDFHMCAEDLYRTKKGNWFVAGMGGALSCYATQHGNTTSGGYAIRALTQEEALQWFEEKCPGHRDIEKYFKIEEA